MLQLIHLCDIKRKTAVGNVGRTSLSTLANAVPCLVLPQNNSNTSVSNGFDLGRPVDFYFSVGQDVKEGDQLSYNGNTYTVQAVQTYDVPIVGHVHALAQQEIN